MRPARSSKKTQTLKPIKVMSPPFEEDVMVDGFYPQMSIPYFVVVASYYLCTLV